MLQGFPTELLDNNGTKSNVVEIPFQHNSTPWGV
jgi:hypothetical protein